MNQSTDVTLGNLFSCMYNVIQCEPAILCTYLYVGYLSLESSHDGNVSSVNEIGWSLESVLEVVNETLIDA